MSNSIGEMDLYAKAKKLQEVKNEIAKLEEVKDKLKGDEFTLKTEITKQMVNDHNKMSEKFKDIRITRVSKITIKISNENLAYNSAPEIEKENLMKIDTLGLKALAENIYKNTGEILRGAEKIEGEYLTVKAIEKEEK